MTKIINIKNFKDIKKNTLILKDLKDMINLLDKVSDDCFKYKKYTYMREILAVVENNKQLLKIAQQKFLKDTK